MAFFSVRGNGLLEALLRFVGLVLVVGLCGWGFWANSQRQMDRLNSRLGLGDQDKLLTEPQRMQVQAFITTLRQRYGIEARVQVTSAAPLPPSPEDKDAGKTLFIGLSPTQKIAVVTLPPLVDRALGPDFARQLAEEHFPFYFTPGKNWQKGLLLALDLIETRLASLGAAATPQAQPHPGGLKESQKP
jgi:hypothetical protein